MMSNNLIIDKSNIDESAYEVEIESKNTIPGLF